MKTTILIASLVLAACTNPDILCPLTDSERCEPSSERGSYSADKGVSGRGGADQPSDPIDSGSPGLSDGPSDKGKGKSNASANNGRGGNYDKTGHEDNGRGKR